MITHGPRAVNMPALNGQDESMGDDRLPAPGCLGQLLGSTGRADAQEHLGASLAHET